MRTTKLLYYMTTFDGGVYPSGKGHMFIMNMLARNRDYLEWVQQTIEQFTSVSIRERKDYNTDGCVRQPQLRLESRVHPVFSKIRERVYIDGHKVIDPHMLTMMDAEALAIIFMADGGSYLEKRTKKPTAYFSLNTKGFSYADNQALSKAIYEKTGIRSNTHRHNSYYYLGVPQKDSQLFYDTVTPFVLPSFQYKLERVAPALQGDDIVCSLS